MQIWIGIPLCKCYYVNQLPFRSFYQKVHGRIKVVLLAFVNCVHRQTTKTNSSFKVASWTTLNNLEFWFPVQHSSISTGQLLANAVWLSRILSVVCTPIWRSRIPGPVQPILLEETENGAPFLLVMVRDQLRKNLASCYLDI